jgi:hypothetical protein
MLAIIFIHGPLATLSCCDMPYPQKIVDLSHRVANLDITFTEILAEAAKRSKNNRKLEYQMMFN